MKELSAGWKFFRILAIVQLVLVAALLMLAMVALFSGNRLVIHLAETICYALVFWFLFLGLGMLNDNFPDNPLPPALKRRFNWLFLLNSLAIVLLFAKAVSEWNALIRLGIKPFRITDVMQFTAPAFLLHNAVFLFHMLFLVGMFRLRRAIHKNTIINWQEQFGRD